MSAAAPAAPLERRARAGDDAADGDALLDALGLPGGLDAAGERLGAWAQEPADLAWARSGAMPLAGHAGAPPRLAPAPLASRARRAAALLARLAGGGALAALDGAALLGERAAIARLRRRGRTSPGGATRLLPAGDGWLAVALARPEDVRSVPAWLEIEPPGAATAPWPELEPALAGRPVAELVARARLLGLPVAEAARTPAPGPWARVSRLGEARAPRGGPPRVLDLSALWAGPLCAQLLALAGAPVVKVESAERPDGARRGPPRFYDLLNHGKASLVLELRSAAGRETLLRLVESADIVVESARPRALAQLGIDAQACVAARPGLTWLSVTGYGRREPGAGWVGFGDDAAAAAGLAVATGAPAAEPCFCGDAIADPLAGLHAAVAGLAAHRLGGGWLVDVALCAGVGDVLACREPVREARVVAAGGGHALQLGRRVAPVRAPRARRAAGRARPLGADTHAVLRELGLSC